MTLNGIIVPILRFSQNLIALLAKYVTVVEYRPIMSVWLKVGKGRSEMRRLYLQSPKVCTKHELLEDLSARHEWTRVL